MQVHGWLDEARQAAAKRMNIMLAIWGKLSICAAEASQGSYEFIISST